jgi:hypothetical protein
MGSIPRREGGWQGASPWRAHWWTGQENMDRWSASRPKRGHRMETVAADCSHVALTSELSEN